MYKELYKSVYIYILIVTNFKIFIFSWILLSYLQSFPKTLDLLLYNCMLLMLQPTSNGPGSWLLFFHWGKARFSKASTSLGTYVSAHWDYEEFFGVCHILRSFSFYKPNNAFHAWSPLYGPLVSFPVQEYSPFPVCRYFQLLIGYLNSAFNLP